jgi:predicted RNA methylase
MLTFSSAESANRVRDLFNDAGYTKDGMREVLLYNELPARHLRNLPRLLERTREPGLLNSLLRLFAFGIPVDDPHLLASIPDWFVETGIECGFLEATGRQLSATVMLAPFEQMLIATDHSLKIEAANDPNAVLLVNPTTWLLHRFSIRRPSRATLDLGAGCAALALAAAAHSDAVTATDLNPRCTEFASFNAALNGLTNVECLTGSMFEPVAGRSFDSILTNPPFFITPAVDHLFCDNEMELDGFCRQLLRQAPRHLNEGGFLQMVCEWVQVDGQDWKERISEWVEGLGCDAWILRGHSAAPEKYAADRIRETTLPSAEADAANYQSWTSFYREKGVRAIHRGLIALRRRSGRNWLRFDESPTTPKHPFGDSVLRRFVIEDFLAGHSSDDALLSASLTVAAGSELLRTMENRGDGWTIDDLHLVQTGGIPRRQKIEPLVSEFLAMLDGRTPLREAVKRLSTQVNAPPDQVGAQCLGIIRRMLSLGFLVPPEVETC